jgi:peptidyl-prolyl cis-trans isomerase SurA
MNLTLKKTICFLSISYAIVTASEAAKYIDRIVAVVNDDIITLSELNVHIEPYVEQIRARNYSSAQERKMLFAVREKVLNQLIDQKLGDQEIKRAKIDVSELEIDRAIERIKEARLSTDEELREELKAQGFSMEEYRNRIKEQILRTRLVNLEVKSKIIITQEDIKAYYNSHPELYGSEKKYHLRNIIKRPPVLAGEGDEQSVLQTMEAIFQKLKNGESFETLAKQFSESPVAAQGGDLGTFEIGALAPQIQAAVKDLKPGEFTGILKTDLGYQIFYIEDIINSAGKSIDEVSEEIREKLFNDIVDEKYRLWLEALRKRSHIRIIK